MSMTKSTVTVYARKDVGAKYIEWLSTIGSARILQVVVAGSDGPVSLAASTHGIEVIPWEHRGAILPSDLAVSILFPNRLRAEQLVVARRGAINFHPAPLPDYQGVGGYSLAILEGRDTWGVSAHYMSTEIDAGAIIAVDYFPISNTATSVQRILTDSYKALFEQAKRVTVDALKSETKLPTTPNNGGRYVSRPQLESMKRIEPGDDVARKVRAFWFPPYRGAYIEINGNPYTLVSDDLLAGDG